MGDATKKSTDDLEIESQEVKDEQELNAAFEAGFEDKDFEIETKKVTEEEIVVDKKETVVDKKETVVDKKETVVDKKEPVVDEWDGLPSAVKKRFTTMEDELKRVTNIANTASGRASKLQGQIEKQNLPKPKPSSEQIRAAMTDKDKREALRVDFSEFADAMDEADDRVALAVGEALDKFKVEMSETQTRTQSDFESKRNLDIKHPNWEQTVATEDFKAWVFEGGPAESERKDYENLVNDAQALHGNSPTESAAMFNKANKYYNELLTKYPTWATKKGTMFNDPSGTSAIKLLDVYVESTNIDNNDEVIENEAKVKAKTVSNNRQQRLADNVTPTSGKISDVPPADDEDVEKAFADGFNS